MALVSFLIIWILFIACGVHIFRYLVNARKLFQSMENEFPQLYERLDSPKVYIRVRSSFGTHYSEGGTITGQIKGIAWLIKGDFSAISGETLELAITVRRLFFRSLLLFSLAMIFFLPLFSF